MKLFIQSFMNALMESTYLSIELLMQKIKKQFNMNCFFGGDKGARTLDPLRARQVLSQAELYPHMVDLQGLEPRTDRL